MKFKEIKIDLFEAYVFIFWDCKPIEVHKYITKNLKGLAEHVPKWFVDNNDEPPAGVCVSEYGISPNCVIWLSENPTKNPGLLAHEIAHATHRIMKHWSIELDESSQEILAMIMGYLVRKALSK